MDNLSRRDHIAALLFAGILSGSYAQDHVTMGHIKNAARKKGMEVEEYLANDAVEGTDALMKLLAKTAKVTAANEQPRMKALVDWLKEEKAEAEEYLEKDMANADREGEAGERGAIETIDKIMKKLAELDPTNPLFKK